jgi:integrase
MAKSLTPLSVQAYRPKAKRREIPDSTPGLFLIVQPSGRKSWALRFRRNGKPVKMTLGRFDDAAAEPSDEAAQGAPLTLAMARELATKIARERARGVDVIQVRKADKLRNQTAAVDRAANSFGVVIREFFIKHRTKKWNSRARRWREDAAVLGLKYPSGCADPATVEPEVIKGSLAESWVDKPITDIDKYEVEAIIEEAHKHGNAGRARKLYAMLSIVFDWLPLKYRVAINPMIGVKRPGTPRPGERELDETEIKIFWKACDALGGVYGPLYQMLLLTGCRLREVSDMTRDELGDATSNSYGVWEIPGDRSKNHLPLLLPLPQPALDIINNVKSHDAGLVFTNNGRTPVSGFSRHKKLLDAEMSRIAGHPIKFRIHDLRRTFSTKLNESPDDGGLGIAPHIVEALLNHVSGSRGGVAGTYNRARYLPEKRVALARWADHIEGLVSGRKATVTPLRKKRQ